MPKASKALKTWCATSALIFPAVGTFYLARDLPFVDTGILAAQFTIFGHPVTFGLLIATILTVTALCLVYALVRRTGRNPSRLRRQGDTVRRRQTMINGAADHGSDGILVIDETGFILDTNPAAKQMLGAGAQDYGRQTLVDRHIGSLRPDATALMSDSPEERNALSRLARVLAAGDPPAAGVRRGFYLDIQA